LANEHEPGAHGPALEASSRPLRRPFSQTNLLADELRSCQFLSLASQSNAKRLGRGTGHGEAMNPFAVKPGRELSSRPAPSWALAWRATPLELLA